VRDVERGEIPACRGLIWIDLDTLRISRFEFAKMTEL
jgi:hypothetical protein